MKTLCILVLIIILGAILRLVDIGVVPPSLNWDEISHGYNAYSILKTGRDEWGQLLPLTNFRAYGDYPLPLNLYITIPFIAAFGLNDLSIRFPHALIGVLTIIASYFLAYGVTKRKDVSLLVSFLVSVEPWFLFPSRFVVQSNLSVFFLIASMAAFFNRDKSKYLIPLSFFLLGITLFSYHTTRIFSPLILFVLLFIYKKELTAACKIEKIVFLASLLILVLFFAPLPFILANPEARARSQAVFLIDEGAVGRIVKQRSMSGLTESLSKLIYNRPTYFAYEFLKNYIDYFSPNFLFLKGGTQYQFSVPDLGLLYPVNLPFFYLGLLIFAKQALNGNKNYRFVLAWLFLGAIPAALTTERFAVLRSTTMLPVPQILIAIGILDFTHWVDKRLSRKAAFLLIAIYLTFLGFNLANYLRTYFISYPKEYSWAWQYGYNEVVEYVKAHYSEYNNIIVTKKYGEPHEFILFYWPWNPAQYRTDSNLVRFNKSNWYWVDRFDKFYFVNDWEIPKDGSANWRMEYGGDIPLTGRTLLVTSPGNYPSGWKLLNTIYFLDSKPAFDILEK